MSKQPYKKEVRAVMTRDPVNTTLSAWQCQLLSDIFRIILPEVMSEADGQKLAPGELGINYKDGTLVIRNPHTGELFSPNSLKYLQPILNKYNYSKDILNADTVDGVTIYSRLTQLDDVGINFTPDTVLRQMHHPAILFAPVTYENYEQLNWPSDNGICVAYKSDEGHVFIRYYDNNACAAYEGRYNYIKQMFEGWADISGHGIFAETINGGLMADIRHKPYTGDLPDLSVITVRVTNPLFPGAKLSYNNGEYMPIVDTSGEPLAITIAPNNIIMLVYDKQNSNWVLLRSTDSALQTTVSMLSERLRMFREEATREIIELRDYIDEKIQNNADDLEAALKSYTDNAVNTAVTAIENKYDPLIDRLDKKPGNIISIVQNMEIIDDNVTEISNITGFNGGIDKIIVNYGQTMLRPSIDYTVSNNDVILKNNIVLNSGDKIQFIILKQEQSSP